MSRTTVVLTEELQEQAKEHDINISDVCRQAVAAAIDAKKTAAKLGGKLQRVEAWLPDEDDRNERGEKVVFYGRIVHKDERTDNDYYVTKGNTVAIVDERGILWVYDDDLSSQMPLYDFVGGEGKGLIYQRLAEALGEVGEPTELDI